MQTLSVQSTSDDSSPKKPVSPPLKERIDNFSGTLLVTDEHSKVLYVNKAVRDTTGYSAGETIGKKPGELWGGHMEYSFYERLWKRLTNEQLPFIAKVQNTKKNGQAYQEELHIAPILNAEGQIKFFIELQPGKQAGDTTSAFSRDFKKSLERQHDDPWSTVEFLLRTFSLGVESWEALATVDSAQHPRAQIVSFLENTLIKPTEVAYGARYADKELVLAAQTEHAAFDKLYAKYYEQVRRYFLQRTGHDDTLADDLSQETFLQAFRYLPQFTVSNASYLTYLLRIAHNVLVSYFRKTKFIPIDETILAETTAAPAINYADIFDLERVWEIVGRLAPLERQIIMMKYQDDRPVKDIAGAVGKSENAVKLHLSRAREKIRQMIGQK